MYCNGKPVTLDFKLLDMRVGQTVGLCVTQSGELHCYIDGIDKGILCTDMPTDVSYWGIADLYGKTTRAQLVKLTKVQPVAPKQDLVKILREEIDSLEKQLQVKTEQVEREKAEKEEMERMNQELRVQNQELQRNASELNEQVKELEAKVTAIEQSWKVNYKEVTLTKQELGRGGWGVIWIGEFRGQKIAVKQMHELIVSPEFLKLLNREIGIMAQLRHPNLLQFIGAVLDHPSCNPLIITEIMDISLRGAYEKKQLSPVPVSICLSIMRDVAVGLNYLHCLPDPIIHRDVSSANVLLESKGPGKWKTKISDFGSAKFARSAVTKAAGAAVYSAPEALCGIATIHKKKQTTKMDVYSYGVLLWEVMTCTFPNEDIFHNLLEQIEASSPSMHQLILQCTCEDPKDRPTIKQVIECFDGVKKIS